MRMDDLINKKYTSYIFDILLMILYNLKEYIKCCESELNSINYGISILFRDLQAAIITIVEEE
jgi:hypothetical protein